MKSNRRKTKDERRRTAHSSFVIGHSSIPEALNRAAQALAATDNYPRLTAEVLLAHILGLARTQLLARPEQTVTSTALTKYERLVERAADGEPLAYLDGHREFYGLDFLVDSRVLVPRPETELLIDLALRFTAELAENAEIAEKDSANSANSALSAVKSPLSILDVGTGSGCIAVTLAVKLPSARITALDISADALAVARANAERHDVADRTQFIQSDLLSSFQLPTSHFPLLIANLPYIASEELQQLPVSKHEPILALDGGPDGLALIRRLLKDAPRVMAAGGRLLLEINDEKSAEASDIARAAFPAAHVGIHKDFAGLDRVVAVIL